MFPETSVRCMEPLRLALSIELDLPQRRINRIRAMFSEGVTPAY